MSVPYTKSHLNFEGQLERIRSRGLHVSDPVAAQAALARVGYYRLSAYLHTYRVRSAVQVPEHDVRDDRFIEGASFDQVIALCEFDRNLRLVLLAGLERFEIALRTAVAYHAGKVDPFIHHKPGLLSPEFVAPPPTTQLDRNSAYDRWLVHYVERVDGSSGEAFVQWFSYKYESMLPIWVAIEVMEFGSLTRLLRGKPLGIRRAVAEQFGIATPKLLMSWAATFNGLRNYCAHHARIWNRTLVTTAARPKPDSPADLLPLRGLGEVAAKKLYAPLTILGWLIRQSDPDQRWTADVVALLEGFPADGHVSLEQSGFPEGWRDEPVWRDVRRR